MRCNGLTANAVPFSYDAATFGERCPFSHRSIVDFKVGDTVIYPQHGACIVEGRKKKTAFGVTRDYLILRAIIGEMTLSVPLETADVVGVRPPVGAEELDDLVSVLSKPDPRVPSNWSRRFKNHQEKLKSGDVYQVAEVVRNLAARNRDAALAYAFKLYPHSLGMAQT